MLVLEMVDGVQQTELVLEHLHLSIVDLVLAEAAVVTQILVPMVVRASSLLHIPHK